MDEEGDDEGVYEEKDGEPATHCCGGLLRRANQEVEPNLQLGVRYDGVIGQTSCVRSSRRLDVDRGGELFYDAVGDVVRMNVELQKQ